MNSQVQKLINAAKAEIGYLEKASNARLNEKTANAGSANYTKYGAWFGWNGVAWCHIFVSYMFNAVGMSTLAPKTASCYNGLDWFRNRGQFFLRGSKTPQAGDIIYYSSSSYPNGGAHVGIVTGCDGKYVYTIEGNTSGASGVVANGGGVCAKSYSLGYSRIYGYGRPKYKEEQKEDDEVIEKKNILVDGKVYSCDVIEKENTNFVKMRSLSQAGYSVVYDAARDIPAITAPQCRADIPDGDAEVQAAIEKIQEKTGLEEQTISYLLRYQYGDDLVKKIAKAL